MAKATGNVVVISKDNTVLHVGDADEILPHLDVNSQNLRGVRAKLPEMYDDTGLPLDIATLRGAVQLTRNNARAKVNEEHLMDRIWLALAMMQVKANEDPNNQNPGFRVPVLQGNLRVVLAGLAAAFESLPAAADGDDTAGSETHMRSRHPHY